MTPQLTFMTLVFGSVSLFTYAILRMILGEPRDSRLRDRLSSATDGANENPRQGPTALLSMINRVGEVAAQPFMPSDPQKQSALRRSLARAGMYSPGAGKLLLASKLILLCLGLAGGYVVGAEVDNLMAGLSFGGLIGYLLPTLWLKSRITSNQKQLSYGLADALDLMVVCVEAGLTVDAAMQRVGQELAIAHPAISREFGIAHMESRVGMARQDSLRNLGVRTGNEGLQQVAAMLVQAERFGTSVGAALRIQADTLRVKRQHAAEEMAAKASVKLSFPLVLFIFPATFIVLAGPTVLSLLNSELMK